MLIKARINKDKIYYLTEWNAGDFTADPVLKIQSVNIPEVKEAFKTIDTVEIYIENEPVAEYSIYDTYSDIQYYGSVFVTGENAFRDCLGVRLQKSSLAEQVQRIEDQINPVIDIDSMDLPTLKEYKKSLISKSGSQDIYAGSQVTFKDGTTKTFTFSQNDQQNLNVYLGLIGQADEEQRKALLVPYHSLGEECTFYDYEQIVTIFFTLQLKLLDRYTRVNMLRLYVDSLDDIEVVKQIDYNTPLPAEYEARKAEIVQASIASIIELKKKYGLDDEAAPEDEDEEPTPVEPTE